MRRQFIASLCLLFAESIANANTIIDTLPQPGALAPAYRFGSGGESHDIATSFTVLQPGFITQIVASLYAEPVSIYKFYVGIASDQLIGNPPVPNYFAAPPGTLWNAAVCSTDSDQGATPSCSQPAPDYAPGAPTVQLARGQMFSATTNIYLPSAGTYWFYTWAPLDISAGSWVENAAFTSTDIAMRQTSNPNDSIQNTFRRVSVANGLPGLDIDFTPAQVPEPGTIWLLGIASIVLLTRRQFGHSAIDWHGNRP